MLYPLIGVRLHGWLDDVVVLIYAVGALVLGLHGLSLATALGAATMHFTLARLTNYPQGTIKLIPFRVHAFIELGEGLAVLAVAGLFLSDAAPMVRAFLLLMGASQLTAFAFSDYAWPRVPAVSALR